MITVIHSYKLPKTSKHDYTQRSEYEKLDHALNAAYAFAYDALAGLGRLNTEWCFRALTHINSYTPEGVGSALSIKVTEYSTIEIRVH